MFQSIRSFSTAGLCTEEVSVSTAGLCTEEVSVSIHLLFSKGEAEAHVCNLKACVRVYIMCTCAHVYVVRGSLKTEGKGALDFMNETARKGLSNQQLFTTKPSSLIILPQHILVPKRILSRFLVKNDRVNQQIYAVKPSFPAALQDEAYTR